jgi:hypothetical protein
VDDAAGRARLLRRALATPRRAGAFQARWFALPAFAAACALVAWAVSPKNLRFQVSGATQPGSYVSAPAEHSVVVEFSDQTRVVLAQSSALRVEGTSPRGAHLLLERGTAAVNVVHRARAEWTFAAGPFDVHVTGTRFELSWDPASQVFELMLREGSVEIQTPLSSAPVELRAGQDFRGDLTLHTLTTTELRNRPSAPPPAVLSAPAAPVPPPPLTESVDAPASTSASTSNATARSSAMATLAPRGWPKLIAAGKFDTLLQQANERGLSGCFRGCFAADLSALADAARYTGQGEIAEQSLLALRARFLRETPGRSAAFLLGRLRESQGATNDAGIWYDRYLSETPNGAYAAEALAGKMRSVLKISGAAQAQPIAEEYLQRYPSGVHADTAHSILGSR